MRQSRWTAQPPTNKYRWLERFMFNDLMNLHVQHYHGHDIISRYAFEHFNVNRIEDNNMNIYGTVAVHI